MERIGATAATFGNSFENGWWCQNSFQFGNFSLSKVLHSCPECVLVDKNVQKKLTIKSINIGTNFNENLNFIKRSLSVIYSVLFFNI